MSLAEAIKTRIDKLEPGKVITFDDFADLQAFQTVALNLSRLKREGVIQRLSKGRYYKPKKTKYAVLKPTDTEILNSILRKTGGYISGNAVLNKMGISTQIPSEIVISGSRSSRKSQIANLRLRFIKGQRLGKVSNEILNIVEALKAIKRIPSNEIDMVIRKVFTELEDLNNEQMETLVEVSLRYRPFVRALLGALMEEGGQSDVYVSRLRSSLNPISAYKIGKVASGLANAKKWNIK